MTLDPAMRVAIALARQVAQSPNARWCLACVEVLAVSGAGITLMGGAESGPLCVSNPQVGALEDLQFDVGEGPCRDAHMSGRPVNVPSLDRSASQRWPSFVELAEVSGIGAVFAYPLQVNGVGVGVLTLYQAEPGALTAAQHDDCLVMAEVLGATILSLQADEPAGELAAGLETAVAYRAEIYQASGVVAVQLAIPPSEAVVRIRGYAYAMSRPVAAVAADILNHVLRLPDDRSPSLESEV
ncbi:MAG: GAF domain-containing protein [Ilumatobacteraceae bacterium]